MAFGLSQLQERWFQDGRRKQIHYAAAVSMFLTPLLFFYFIFTFYPVIKTLFFSFFKVEIFGVRTSYEFVGFKNFLDVLNEPVFWKCVKNTLIWALSSPFLENSLGLLLALYLRRGTKVTKFFRVLWFMPVLLPQIVVGIIWAWIYNSEWGIFNKILSVVGLGTFAHPWLGDPKTALPSLIFVTTWMWTGFSMIILLAAIASVPKHLLEAATIDGAREIQVLFRVILPLIRPVFIKLIMLSFIGKMKVFDLIWASTLGGPMWATESVATYTVKRAFFWGTFDKGFPSAMATLWFLIILAISILTTILFLRSKELEY